MNISEKAAYFKGLVDGLGVDRDSRDGKLWLTLTDLLADMASEISELSNTADDFADTLDEIGDELSYLEEITCELDMPHPFDVADEDFYDDCDGDCGACGLCDCANDDLDCGAAFSDFIASDEGDVPEDEELEYDGIVYDVTCPVCGEEISFDEDTLDEGYILCPKCGEKLEFDLSED